MKHRAPASRARAESLWLLAFGCLAAVALALCGQSPNAHAEIAAPGASADAVDAGASDDAAGLSSDAGPFGRPSMPAEPSAAAPLAAGARLTHGLSARADGQPVPEMDRPPGALPNDNGPSPVIFPPQEITIRFNHQRHVKELGMSCTTCHEKARTSHDSADSLLPKGTRCDGCHGSAGACGHRAW